VILIILGVVYGLRSKIFKVSHELSQQTEPESPFLDDLDTSKPNSFNENAGQRKWSTPSTVTSILSRGSTSSTFPFFKPRNSSSSRTPYSGQMMYISEIVDMEGTLIAMTMMVVIVKITIMITDIAVDDYDDYDMMMMMMIETMI